jgi:hypothetical protein
VAPLLEEVRVIRHSLAEGGGRGAGVDADDLLASIQGTVASGIDRIEGELVDRIESIKRKETAEQVARSVEAAQVALDRLFTDDSEIVSNLEVVGVRSASTDGIEDNLVRLRRLRGGAMATEEA